MAEAKGAKPSGSKEAGGPPGGEAAPTGKVQFKNVWPLPALVLGGALLAGGAAVYLMSQPKPPADIPLEQAKALVAEKRFQEALDKLNSKDVRNYIDYGNPDLPHRRAFYLARARSLAGAQQTLGLNRAENHRAIVEDYQRAEKEAGPGAVADKEPFELEPADVGQIARSLIALDQIDGEEGALHRIGTLPESEQARRTRLTRELVEHNLAITPSLKGEKSVRRAEQTLELLGSLASDPSTSAADKAWVLARQGEILIAAGRPDEAINKLIRRVGLLKDVPREQQGELLVLLGKAYFQAEQPINAMKQLEAADAMLEKSSPLRADLGVMQARLAQSGVAAESGVGHGQNENDPSALLEFSREKYEGVIAEFGEGRQFGRALLGVAEVEAALRHDDKALEKYAELVDRINSVAEAAPKRESKHASSAEGAPSHEGAKTEAVGGHASEPTPSKGEPAGRDEHGAKDEHAAAPATKAEIKPATLEHGSMAARDRIRRESLGDVTKDTVLTSLMQRFQERFDSGQRESALRYAGIAETMFKDADMPAPILLAIGSTRRALGDAIMAQVREQHAADQGKGGGEFSVENLDVATRAEVKKHYILAGDYLRRHAKTVAAMDPSASAQSLWTAADSYDRAGDLEEARKAFADYANSASDTDQNKPEAKFRLAQVFQAKQEYPAAIDLYRGLVDSRSQPDMGRNAGVVADRSIVPLAQCMLADGDPTNDDEAGKLLKGIVEGGALGPEATAYREALIELGQSAYRREQFPEAIEWLEGVTKRYKDERRIEDIRYLLADSHRREAVMVARTLATQRLPQAQRDQLEAQRTEHLRTARQLFEGVKKSLDKKEPRLRSNLEKIELRNSYFYLGDCAMEMHDYDGAIAAYDDARKQYSEEPSSLVAMAQIVSAYAAQEKWAEARTANERARLQLAKFPESVWQNPDLPMEKRHWERWLDARTLIGQQGQASGSGEGGKSE